jgi:hypothetical protein
MNLAERAPAMTGLFLMELNVAEHVILVAFMI